MYSTLVKFKNMYSTLVKFKNNLHIGLDFVAKTKRGVSAQGNSGWSIKKQYTLKGDAEPFPAK